MTEARTLEDILETLARFDPGAAALIRRELTRVPAPRLPTPSPWHCTANLVTYPGCGRCGPCRELAPRVFAELRWLRTAIGGADQ